MKILFAGTPEFALPCLDMLANSFCHQVLRVYTAPPKPKNRGKNICKTPIHLLSDKYGISVHNPIDLKSQEEQKYLSRLNIDIIVVVAYGLIIPKYMLHYAKYGCINLHPSLLPKWRGAAPIQRSIMNGDSMTGISIMQLDQGLDSGDILMQRTLNIQDSDDYQIIHDKCADIGAQMIIDTLDNLDDITPIQQDHNLATYAHKLEKSDGRIDWNLTTHEIINLIRGYPGGVFFVDQGLSIKCFSATYDNNTINLPKPGTITQYQDHIAIACLNGVIYPQIVQRPGKSKISIKDFLKGYTFSSAIVEN